jgi:hypothetical protein
MKAIHTSDTNFWSGFEKRGSLGTHAAELAGLGMLAYPSIQSLRKKPMTEKSKDIVETAGLGVLAAPSIHAIGKKLLKR